jgi:hypothetical protein
MSAECETCGGDLVGFLETLECPSCSRDKIIESLQSTNKLLEEALDLIEDHFDAEAYAEGWKVDWARVAHEMHEIAQEALAKIKE